MSSIFLFSAFFSSAQSSAIILSDQTKNIIVKNEYIFKDSSCSIDFSLVSSAEFQKKFQGSAQNNNSLQDNIFCYWIRFKIINNSGKSGEWLLEFDKWKFVDVFLQDSTNRFTKKSTGQVLPFINRDFPLANRNLISINLNNGESIFCYAKLKDGNDYFEKPDDLSFIIHPKALVIAKEDTLRNVIGFFTGIYIVMFFYNLFIFFSIKERAYGYYLILILFSLFAVWENTGYVVQQLKWFRQYPAWLSLIDITSSSLFGITIILFTRTFLKTKQYQPKLDKGFSLLIVSLILIIIPAFLGNAAFANNLSALLGIVTSLIIFFAAIKSYLMKLPSSGLFLLANTSFVIGIILYLPTQIEFLPHNSISDFYIQLGSSLQIVLFSFALADSINVLKKQNAEKQEQIIQHLRVNNELQTKANAELEQKVEERTKELRESQKQLVQQEKLASLGELTAGVAHEIQNPLNFINNFSEVSVEMINEMKEGIENKDYEDAKQIAADLKANLAKIVFHGKRADSIVKGMLEHSRANSGQKEPVDINNLCDEYLRLSYQGRRAKSKDFNTAINKFFDESIGTVFINAQDMGRVLLNIFSNAFDALDEKRKTSPADYSPQIEVSTKKVNSSVEIKIKDNGSGIPQKIIDKIFQPFFTTKPSGQGTGLGLSISYEIIKSYNGELKVNSQEGVQTEFIITIPI